MIERYNIKDHCYADDAQVYMTLKPCDELGDISYSITACDADVTMLKLNKDKTEFIVFSSNQHVEKTGNLRIKVRFSYINSLRNLGLILDTILGMEKQVNYICKSCYY